MVQVLPRIPMETPSGTTNDTGGSQTTRIRPAANDNYPAAANDNNPRANTRGRILTTVARRAARANLLYEGAVLVGRVLFDPYLFGDNNAYFADLPTHDAAEAELVKQGEIDIKENGMDPTMVRSRVRREIEEKRQREKKEHRANEAAERAENVRVNGICKVLASEVFEQAKEVQGRFADLFQDKLDLYNIARVAPSPSLPFRSGSWQGHIDQIKQQQTKLRKLIAEYDKNNCRQPHIPQSIRDLAKFDVPARPGGVPGYPVSALPK
jgi:hypothetical protein